MRKKYDIAAYVWPSYTGDEPRTRIFWEEGYGEWQTVHNSIKNGMAKQGYEWKRRPLWGYVNEANSDVMEMQIACAARHGVNVFIYDWYWYDGRPFLENCLNDGYLKARNNDLVKFYLMWANHSVTHMWHVGLSSEVSDVIWDGSVGMSEFKLIVERWITKYFTHPSYYKIDGKPVLMIYDLWNFVRGFDGLDGARKAIEYFRNEVVKAGFPGLHLQMVTRDIDYYHELGFDSVSDYQMHGYIKNETDFMDFSAMVEATKEHFEVMDKKNDVLYFPHVSVGWDNNPRYKKFKKPVLENATPEKVEECFKMAKEYVDTHELPMPLITVNSWNEWTETSYLQPDNLYGYAYLEVIKRVFLDKKD